MKEAKSRKRTKAEKVLVNIAAILVLPSMVTALALMAYTGITHTVVGLVVLYVCGGMMGMGVVLLLIAYGIQIKLRREW